MLNFSTREASNLIKFIKGLDIDVHGNYNGLDCKVISYDNVNKNVGVMIGGRIKQNICSKQCNEHQYIGTDTNLNCICLEKKGDEKECDEDNQCISNNCKKIKTINKQTLNGIKSSVIINSGICGNQGGNYNIKYVSVTNITVNNIFI